MFDRLVPVLQTIQRCSGSASVLTCIETATTDGSEYDYIFVARKKMEITIFGDGLIAELNNNEQYDSVYKSIDAAVFKLLK